jgi:hypothetical protein
LKKNHLIVVIFIVMALFVAWLINMGYLFSDESPNTPIDVQFQNNLSECITISEKSVAHMKALVAFQQLEIIGRKARVMRNCMQDHQYMQNQKWTDFANPIAEMRAQALKISFDEAFETLRREHMVMLKPPKDTPAFWIVTPPK